MITAEENQLLTRVGPEPMNVFRDPAEAACIEIATERAKTLRPAGPAAKYSPITPEVQALFA